MSLSLVEMAEIEKIKKMSQVEMARLWKYAPSGHPYFDQRYPLWKVFNEHFKGFTPAISKAIDVGR